jgi:hypothetical protein
MVDLWPICPIICESRETTMHLQVYGKNKSGETLWVEAGSFQKYFIGTAVEWASRGRKTANLEITTENYYNV